MEIEYDSAKEERNLRVHGISLQAAVAIFDGKPAIKVDSRRDYGETRLIATGEIAGRLHICVYTQRGQKLRIISLRRANRRERNAHDQS